MLLEFRVRNFRSIRDEAILSLAASPDDLFREKNTVPTGLDKIPRVVNTTAIYGPNASGKSNFVKAIAFMQSMIATSPQIQPDGENNLSQFRMAKKGETTSSLFEATFVINSRRYQYGFELDRKRILSEWLLVYEKPKPQVWFSRVFDESSERYTFSYSDYFTGSKKVWENATRKEVLFLSTAIQLNNEQLKPIHQAIVDGTAVFSEGMRTGFDFSSSYIESPDKLDRVVKLIKSTDVGISQIKIKSISAKQFSWSPHDGQTDTVDTEIKMPQFIHKTEDGEFEFDLSEESAGTQLFFSISGPLLDILDKGRLLIIDEIDRSLHPLLVREIIGMFNSKATNPHGAQLIFTTHDASFLASNTIRRDQIWFTEKDNEHASHLFPLLDFSPRKGEALEKNYLTGRYGAVPILEKFGE